MAFNLIGSEAEELHEYFDDPKYGARLYANLVDESLQVEVVGPLSSSQIEKAQEHGVAARDGDFLVRYQGKIHAYPRNEVDAHLTPITRDTETQTSEPSTRGTRRGRASTSLGGAEAVAAGGTGTGVETPKRRRGKTADVETSAQSPDTAVVTGPSGFPETVSGVDTEAYDEPKTSKLVRKSDIIEDVSIEVGTTVMVSEAGLPDIPVISTHVIPHKVEEGDHIVRYKGQMYLVGPEDFDHDWDAI